jgi:HAE1 family hydrophobic/amphiphilic exporter-1
MAIGLPEFSVTWGPFATSFIAGLAVATAMTLLVVPCLYLVLDRWQQRVGSALQQQFPHLAEGLDEGSSSK